MRTLIIGGGKVGSYLARALSSAGHTVTIVEADPARAQSLGERSRLLVLAGDGTDVDVLNNADAARSDWVLGVTGKDEDWMVFKVSQLRNVAVTGPWFHDGSGTDLAEVVRIMGRIQLATELNNQEAEDIVAFLHALTGKAFQQGH